MVIDKGRLATEPYCDAFGPETKQVCWSICPNRDADQYPISKSPALFSKWSNLLYVVSEPLNVGGMIRLNRAIAGIRKNKIASHLRVKIFSKKAVGSNP